MCNGTSTRVSQGGSIAVLRPISSDAVAENCCPEECQLIFQNRHDAVSQWHTQVELQGWERKQELQKENMWVIIQSVSSIIPQGHMVISSSRDGDLTAQPSSFPPNQLPAQPFYSFALDKPNSTMKLPQRLDLGVGESGIMGRRITIMNGAVEGSRTVAQGVIGWN